MINALTKVVNHRHTLVGYKNPAGELVEVRCPVHGPICGAWWYEGCPHCSAAQDANRLARQAAAQRFTAQMHQIHADHAVRMRRLKLVSGTLYAALALLVVGYLVFMVWQVCRL